MRYALAAVLLALCLAACETSIDPSTGERQTRLTLPFTEANREAQQRRWQECVQFRSESFCERNVPGGRPVGRPVADDDRDYPTYYRRDP